MNKVFQCIFLAIALIAADESAPGSEKLDSIMGKVYAQEGTSSRVNWYDGLKLLTDDLRPSMDFVGDEAPYCHSKRIHAVGVVCSTVFEADASSPFTGIFQSGSPHSLMRFSLATTPSATTTTPGIGMKFLRDGVPSGNFVAMPSLEGQQEGNFFHNEFSNHVEEPTSAALKVIARRFERTAKYATFVGLSDIATYDTKGKVEENPVFPYQLTLKPSPIIKEQFKAMKPDSDLQENLTSFNVRGVELFRVYGLPAPGAERVYIGKITATSKFIKSKYGDEKVFFKHQRMIDDFGLKPSWLESETRQLRASKCPFAL